MRTFAEVNEDNVVTNVAVFDDENTPVDLGWSGWYETGEGMRKNIAGPGSMFVSEAEGYPLGLFYPPSPHATWVLDDNYEWQPPADKPYPEGWPGAPSTWYWNDTEEDWVEATPQEEEEEDEEEEEEEEEE